MLKQVGKATYCINMHDRRKRKRVFHMNMLHVREFFSPTQAAGWAEDVEVGMQNEIPVWKETGLGTFSTKDIYFREKITAEQ